ncbi:MAG TPA: PQQ-binding-like beta-propeller repeat protein, partial [Acidimicrobiales bacterium]|nr:PQQ-binding-like beta-propeller repeat protein [Acidimicrobiales bacterium]
MGQRSAGRRAAAAILERVRGRLLAGAALAGAVLVAGSPPHSALGRLAATSPVSTTGNWLTYHQSPDRQGADVVDVGTQAPAPAWRVGLDGAVYGEPLVFDGMVVAATENDSVYAIDGRNGAILWHRVVGVPATQQEIWGWASGGDNLTGCGDIFPLGITSTPVIDPSLPVPEVFVVAEEGGGTG